jgi:hypothetical protein
MCLSEKIGSRNSSLESMGNDVVDNVQEMEEDNANEDQEADVADQEDLALTERHNEEDDLQDDADGDIEDDIAATDFIHGLLHFGAPAHDEYEESEYDEEEVDMVNHNLRSNGVANIFIRLIKMARTMKIIMKTKMMTS